MRELIIKIEEKLQSQVEHISRMYESHELPQKMFDLGMEWYIKGVQEGIAIVRKDFDEITNQVLP